MASVALNTSCFNFENLPSNYKLPNPNKILLLHTGIVNQVIIQHALAKYKGLRDFHNSPSLFAPFVHYVNIVATALNASLLSSQEFNTDDCPNDTLSAPKVHLFVFGEDLEAGFKRQSEIHGEATRPAVIQLNPYVFNFAYCSKPSRNDDFSPLELFRTSADIPTWVCLVTSLVLVSLVIKLTTKGSESKFAYLATLSVLISVGLSAGSRVIQRSWLFMLWMFTSLLLVTFYSGELTSVVIRPAPEFRMTKFVHLSEHNYSMVLRNTEFFAYRTYFNSSFFDTKKFSFVCKM